MTANMRITNVRREGKDLVVEGLVKEFMPMVVRVNFDDAKAMSEVVARRRPRLRQGLRSVVSRIRRRVRPVAQRAPAVHEQPNNVMDFAPIEGHSSKPEQTKQGATGLLAAVQQGQETSDGPKTKSRKRRGKAKLDADAVSALLKKKDD